LSKVCEWYINQLDKDITALQSMEFCSDG